MLLPKNIRPEDSLYFNGSFILQVLKERADVGLLDLFAETRKIRDISMPLFVLSLDWLFLAGLVSLNDRGNFMKCS